MLGKNWTSDEINLLKNYYPNYGSMYVATLLNKTTESVLAKAKRLKIKTNKIEWAKRIKSTKLSSPPKIKLPSEYKVNPNLFTNSFTKESVYILGLLWADGFINLSNNDILLEVKYSDGLEFLPIFLETGQWKTLTRTRENQNAMMTIRTCNKFLVKFLIDMNYGPHNKQSAKEILDLIPNNLKHYWFRGFLDGDGCFYVNIKIRSKTLSFAGPQNQNWSFITDILDELSIENYTMENRIKHPSSNIRIGNYYGIIKFGDYIYQNYNKDKIGLKRKHDKFVLIKTKMVPARNWKGCSTTALR